MCTLALDVERSAVDSPVVCSRCNYKFDVPPEAKNVPFRMAPPRFKCERCGGTDQPVLARRIARGGWIVFGFLLIASGLVFIYLVPVALLGLLLREQYPQCPRCGASAE